MGSKPSAPTQIILIGPHGSGKTHFLDYLIFQGDTTRCDTIGMYTAMYEHDGRVLELIEYGGTPRIRHCWLDLWARHHAGSARAIFMMINVASPVDVREWCKLRGYLLQMLTTQPTVCVCLVLNARESDPPHLISEVRARAVEVFQLKMLTALGWPVRVAVLDYGRMQQWVSVVETLFDWVIEEPLVR
jgi:hypothetical protein